MTPHGPPDKHAGTAERLAIFIRNVPHLKLRNKLTRRSMVNILKQAHRLLPNLRYMLLRKYVMGLPYKLKEHLQAQNNGW